MQFTEQAFRKLFRQWYPQLALYAARLVGDDEADDVVQEAFLELWRNQQQIESQAHCQSYLYRVLYTRALNTIRHRRITQDYTAAAQDLQLRRADFYNPDTGSAAALAENNELHRQLQDAIDLLPDKGRQAFIMSYLHDMPTKEIANIMGISARTVEVHLYRAVKFLRSKLGNVTFLTFFITQVCKLFTALYCNNNV